MSNPAPLPPNLALWALEVPRALLGIGELALHWRRLKREPRGDGRPILLLPGLFNSDRSNVALRAFLRGLGYDAQGWGFGRNLGARTIGADGERLFARVEQMAQRAGQPVTLIGVSLGGMMARLAAQRRPSAVRDVITIASPYAGHPRATNVWRAFEWVTGEKVDSPVVAERLAEIAGRLPVPSTAIWSASDGLVNGAICRDPQAACVEVRSSHMGVQLRPAVLRAVAAALAAVPPDEDRADQRDHRAAPHPLVVGDHEARSRPADDAEPLAEEQEAEQQRGDAGDEQDAADHRSPTGT